MDVSEPDSPVKFVPAKAKLHKDPKYDGVKPRLMAHDNSRKKDADKKKNQKSPVRSATQEVENSKLGSSKDKLHGGERMVDDSKEEQVESPGAEHKSETDELCVNIKTH